VEPSDERVGVERAHAGSSARMAAAAAAGSAAPVIGRPTTR
jgi:phosphoribosylcarboxyaminoimidazole (NCAIR) mutase